VAAAVVAAAVVAAAVVAAAVVPSVSAYAEPGKKKRKRHKRILNGSQHHIHTNLSPERACALEWRRGGGGTNKETLQKIKKKKKKI
jgi:hypothetical protein